MRVYDNNIISPATDTAAAAYEHSQLLHIIAFTGPSLSTHIHSVYTPGPIVAFTGPSLLNAISTLHIHSIYTPGIEQLYNFVCNVITIILLAVLVPTHVVPEKIINNTIIIAFSIGLLLLLVILFVIITFTMLIILYVVARQRRSRGN